MGGNAQLQIRNILLDTGATHGNYIAALVLRQWFSDGWSLVTHSVKSMVRLGDNKTLVPVTMKAEVPVEIVDAVTGTKYCGTVLCSVIESGVEVPIIIGLPAIGRFFTYLVCSALERYSKSIQDEAEYLAKLEVLDLSTPWSVSSLPIAVEELETPSTTLFETLVYLTAPYEEAVAKHNELVDERVSKEWRDYGNPIIALMKSPEALESFLPLTWEGFKNVQEIGANADNEFSIGFKTSLPDSMPCQPRHIPERLRGAAMPELQRLTTYMLTSSNSPIASPTVIAPKATFPYVRIAGDYRLINDHAEINQEYIPRPQFEIHKCKGFCIFLDFDLTNSFHQIKLDYLSSSRLSLSTIIGLVRPRFMPEGVSCGSMLLQKIVRWIFREIEDFSIILFDNLLLLAHDFDDAYVKCKRFLEICRRHNVILKMAKTYLGFREVAFFGYLVREHTVCLSVERKSAIQALAFPRNVKEAQSFLTTTNPFK